MKIRQGMGSLLRLGIIVACVYGAWKWHDGGSSGSDVKAFARSACADAARERYNVSNVRSYDVGKNANGYVVRATVTLPRGDAAKVVCLTNENGGIRDVSINER